MAEAGSSDKLKVFISYSRADMAFADELVIGLEILGFDITIDRHSIIEGEDWKTRLGALIADADAIVVVLSPDSVKSEICAWERDEAMRLSKRILPVLFRPIETVGAPEKLAALNYSRFDEGRPFMQSLRALGRALETDVEWVREHTRLLARAREWHAAGRVANRMLSGADVEAAKAWANNRPKGAPDPTDLHWDFIRASEQTESDRTNAERRRLEEIAAANAERAKALESEAKASRRVFHRTVAGLIAVIIAVAAGGTGIYLKQREAEREREAAEATRDDAAEVARVARGEFSGANSLLESAKGELIDWAPISWHGYLYNSRAQARAEAGDFTGARADFDRALKFDPSLVPLLTSSADLNLITGDAEAAIRDAKAALALGTTDAVVFGNLWLAEAMQRDYASAIAHIDEALAKSQRVIVSTETLIAPDIRDITSGFKLRVRSTDFLLAMRYAKAVLYAMQGDERFATALAEADAWDRDHPYSRAAYIAALNWEWLVVRGQALADARAAGAGAAGDPANERRIREYGAFAAQGALWARVAVTRPDFKVHAAKAFAAFEAAHARASEERYKWLATWLGSEKTRGIPASAEPESPLNAALEIEVQANELARRAGDDTYRIAPAVALISNAIRSFDRDRLGRAPGRREEDLLIDLLLRRGELKIKGKEKDFGGALADARRVLAIDEKIAKAYRLLASASEDKAEKRTALEKALAIDTGNADTYAELAILLEDEDARAALQYKEKERQFRRFWSSAYTTLARLQSKAGLHAEAVASIENAIARWPRSADTLEKRHEYQIKANVAAGTANRLRVHGYRDKAAAHEQTGEYPSALTTYVEAFRLAAKLTPDDANDKLEIDGLTRDFSVFLNRRFGRETAALWWKSVAENPLVTEREKTLALAEAERVSRE